MPNKWNLTKEFILASQSPQRLSLLKNAGFEPIKCLSADIDEDIYENEKPEKYVARVAAQKASFVYQKEANYCIVSADTIIVAKGQIIRKAPDEDTARQNLELLSGSKHYVLTGYSVIFPDGKQITKVCKTKVFLKKITQEEKNALLASKEWENVAAYRIEGMLSTFVKSIRGSYTNIVGLPVYEVGNLLKKGLK
ncbi:MAG: septum formation protein Maf [Alphaproteobacteria bacterium]|nr:septum formation protein Maf [Alphaproteobacteria bacterium]